MTPRRIIVVDDDAAIRRLVALFLRGTDYTVDEAADGHEALQRIPEGGYSTALVDISMPGLSGDELCRRLRADPRTAKLRILAFTAHAFHDTRTEILAAGFDGILLKPFNRATLLEALAGENSPV